MRDIVDLLYRYIAIYASYVWYHMLAMLAAQVPSPGARPALQRVRTPVSPSLDDVRRHNDFLMLWM
jgi:hypothetical protein